MYVKIDGLAQASILRQFDEVRWYHISRMEFDEQTCYTDFEPFMDPGEDRDVTVIVIFGNGGEGLVTNTTAYVMSDSGQTLEILRPKVAGVVDN